MISRKASSRGATAARMRRVRSGGYARILWNQTQAFVPTPQKTRVKVSWFVLVLGKYSKGLHAKEHKIGLQLWKELAAAVVCQASRWSFVEVERDTMSKKGQKVKQ